MTVFTQRRIALEGLAVPFSSTELGKISNMSRKQTNVALHRFAATGWLNRSYRCIIIVDVNALRGFAEHDDHA
ncbi:helix-turn-helix domain-containing protein [Novosphingobium sp. PhB165]|uniref:helix-turn-helix domain-containing protein n=1 Tax=Novosphingobium sp. PhB165 TaxID=2485105 RepID=UPI0014049318|nr:helix-turn-helix domain-containing protein [Novosphingobium sp. PhB165]